MRAETIPNVNWRTWAIMGWVLFALSFSVHFGGPRTYADCVLDNVHGASNDAAQLIHNACMAKFPRK